MCACVCVREREHVCVVRDLDGDAAHDLDEGHGEPVACGGQILSD